MAKAVASGGAWRKIFRSGSAEGGKGGEGGAPDRPVTANTAFATFTPFGSDCWKKWRSVRYREKGPSFCLPAPAQQPKLTLRWLNINIKRFMLSERLSYSVNGSNNGPCFRVGHRIFPQKVVLPCAGFSERAITKRQVAIGIQTRRDAQRVRR